MTMARRRPWRRCPTTSRLQFSRRDRTGVGARFAATSTPRQTVRGGDEPEINFRRRADSRRSRFSAINGDCRWMGAHSALPNRCVALHWLPRSQSIGRRVAPLFNTRDSLRLPSFLLSASAVPAVRRARSQHPEKFADDAARIRNRAAVRLDDPAVAHRERPCSRHGSAFMIGRIAIQSPRITSETAVAVAARYLRSMSAAS